MLKNLFNTKVKIELLEKKLSIDNQWIKVYTLWKEVWASIIVKDFSARGALYLFSIRYEKGFPVNFRVTVDDKVFTPTQSPIVEHLNGLVLFHARSN